MSDARLIEVAYPGLGIANGKQFVVIEKEIICEECLALHDVLLHMAQYSSEEVQ